MDTNIEDKLVHQIEKNLSNSMNENLFTGGRVYEENGGKEQSKSSIDTSRSKGRVHNNMTTVEHYETPPPVPTLTREQYIRQAREACLRQLDSIPSGLGNVDYSNEGKDPGLDLLGEVKKNKVNKMFPQTSVKNSEQEAADFRSLLIRTVCCLVIFLFVFIIDKLKVQWGEFSYLVVRDYITNNDKLSVLEELIISWLK